MTCEGKSDREILEYLLQKQEELTIQLKRRPCILLDDILNKPQGEAS
jgi:hypothetical protein